MKIQNLFQPKYQGMLNNYVKAIAWSLRKETLAAVTAAGEVALWQSGELILLQKPGEYSLDCLGFSADGQYLAVAGQNSQVKIWQLQESSLKLVATIDNGKAWIDCMAWNPTQNILAFGVDRTIKIWHANSQEITVTLNFEASSVFSLAWHNQGELLAVSGHGGVKVWQQKNWQQAPYLLQVPGASLDCAWSADGNYLASGNLDKTISLLHWDNPPPWLMQGFPGKVSQVRWSDIRKKGSPLLASACQDGIIIWQLDSLDKSWQSYVLQKHQGFVKAIAFQPNSLLLASAGDDGYIYLWHSAKKVGQTLKGANQGFASLAWHSTGKYLAAGGQQGELIIWSKSFNGKGFG
ncbi:MAG: WD40 repeat domain-containing protein [Xenococcaceae cyanobacterium]